jgi:hypothetical protein
MRVTPNVLSADNATERTFHAYSLWYSSKTARHLTPAKKQKAISQAKSHRLALGIGIPASTITA